MLTFAGNYHVTTVLRFTENAFLSVLVLFKSCLDVASVTKFLAYMLSHTEISKVVSSRM